MRSNSVAASPRSPESESPVNLIKLSKRDGSDAGSVTSARFSRRSRVAAFATCRRHRTASLRTPRTGSARAACISRRIRGPAPDARPSAHARTISWRRPDSSAMNASGVSMIALRGSLAAGRTTFPPPLTPAVTPPACSATAEPRDAKKNTAGQNKRRSALFTRFSPAPDSPMLPIENRPSAVHHCVS